MAALKQSFVGVISNITELVTKVSMVDTATTVVSSGH